MAKVKAKHFDNMDDQVISSLISNMAVDKTNDMTYETRYVTPEEQGKEGEEIFVDWNLQPREEGKSSGANLVEDIKIRGLQEIPTAFDEPGQDVPVLLQGHRRYNACYLIFKSDPELFKALFPKGLPIKVYTHKRYIDKKGKEDFIPLTHEDGIVIRADHDTDALKQNLTTKLEAIRLVKPFFDLSKEDKRWTTARIIMLTWRTVCKIMSKQYDKLVADYDKCDNNKDRINTLMSSQKGNYQFLRRMSEAPDVLLDYYVKGTKGEAPQLATQKDYEALSIVFKEECAKNDAKLEPDKTMDASNPGKVFEAAFSKSKKENLKGSKKSSKPAGMNKAETEDFITKLSSNYGKLMYKALQKTEGAEVMLLTKYDPITAKMEEAGKKDFKALEFLLDLVIECGLTTKEMKDIKKLVAGTPIKK